MAIRNIVKYGDDILRRTCRTQLTFDGHLHQVLDDMAQTMYAADGVGLAAPQVGILRRYCIVDVGDGLIELINPVLLSSSGSQTGQEGCLSIPGKYDDWTLDLSLMIPANFDILPSCFHTSGQSY